MYGSQMMKEEQISQAQCQFQRHSSSPAPKFSCLSHRDRKGGPYSEKRDGIFLKLNNYNLQASADKFQNLHKVKGWEETYIYICVCVCV